MLTQEQQWGLAFLTQEHNRMVDQQNARITQANQFIPRDKPALELLPKLTVEEYVEQHTAQLANEGYQKLIAFKKQKAIEMFDAMTPEEQAALVAQLQIPDVLE